MHSSDPVDFLDGTHSVAARQAIANANHLALKEKSERERLQKELIIKRAEAERIAAIAERERQENQKVIQQVVALQKKHLLAQQGKGGSDSSSGEDNESSRSERSGES